DVHRPARRQARGGAATVTSDQRDGAPARHRAAVGDGRGVPRQARGTLRCGEPSARRARALRRARDRVPPARDQPVRMARDQARRIPRHAAVVVGGAGMVAAVLALWAALNVLSANPPEELQIEHPVTDLAGVLRPQAEEEIARELVQHRDATGVQLAVLIVDTTHGRDIADYAQAVFDRWGGGSKERDDGALFVLAITDRRS